MDYAEDLQAPLLINVYNCNTNKMDKTTRFYLDNRTEIDEAIAQILPQLRRVYKKDGIQAVCEMVYNSIDTIIEKNNVTNVTTCSRGCSFCCSGKIFVSSLEASLIVSWIEHYGIQFDHKHVENQNAVENIDELPFKESKCALLTPAGDCSIYQIRPVVCRTYNSTSPPDLCDMDKHGVQKIGQAQHVAFTAFFLALVKFDMELENIDLADPMTIHQALNQGIVNPHLNV